MRRDLPRISPVSQRIRRHAKKLGRFRDTQKVLKVFHDFPPRNHPIRRS